MFNVGMLDAYNPNSSPVTRQHHYFFVVHRWPIYANSGFGPRHRIIGGFAGRNGVRVGRKISWSTKGRGVASKCQKFQVRAPIGRAKSRCLRRRLSPERRLTRRGYRGRVLGTWFLRSAGGANPADLRSWPVHLRPPFWADDGRPTAFAGQSAQRGEDGQECMDSARFGARVERS